MIYRVILHASYREYWFDFIDHGQASIFAEAAKLNNVPNSPSKYGSDAITRVTIKLITPDEHKAELKAYEAKVAEIAKEIEEEKANEQAE